METETPIEQPESFFAVIRKGDAQGIKIITVKKEVADYLGLNHGDLAKVWIKKVKKKVE